MMDCLECRTERAIGKGMRPGSGFLRRLPLFAAVFFAAVAIPRPSGAMPRVGPDGTLSVNTPDLLGGDFDTPIVIRPLPGFEFRAGSDSGKVGGVEAIYDAKAEDNPSLLLARFPSPGFSTELPVWSYREFQAVQTAAEEDPENSLDKSENIPDAAALPVHASDGRSFRQTFTGTLPENPDFQLVTTRVSVWARGRFFELSAVTLAGKSDGGDAIAQTRETADSWYRGIAALNSLADAAGDDFECEKSTAEAAIQARMARQRRFEEETRAGRERETRQMMRQAQNKGYWLGAFVFLLAMLLVRLGRKSRQPAPASRPEPRDVPSDAHSGLFAGFRPSSFRPGEAVVGLDLAPDGARAAVFRAGEYRALTVPPHLSAQLASCLALDGVFTEEDAEELREAFERELGEAVGGVTVSLPFSFSIADRTRLFAAFAAGGMPVGRFMARTVAYAYALKARRPSANQAFLFCDSSSKPTEAALVSLEDDTVVEVRRIGKRSDFSVPEGIRAVEMADAGMFVAHGAALMAAVLRKTWRELLLLECLETDVVVRAGEKNSWTILESCATIPVIGKTVPIDLPESDAAPALGFRGMDGVFQPVNVPLFRDGKPPCRHLSVKVGVHPDRTCDVSFWNRETQQAVFAVRLPLCGGPPEWR